MFVLAIQQTQVLGLETMTGAGLVSPQPTTTSFRPAESDNGSGERLRRKEQPGDTRGAVTLFFLGSQRQDFKNKSCGRRIGSLQWAGMLGKEGRTSKSRFSGRSRTQEAASHPASGDSQLSILCRTERSCPLWKRPQGGTCVEAQLDSDSAFSLVLCPGPLRADSREESGGKEERPFRARPACGMVHTGRPFPGAVWFRRC